MLVLYTAAILLSAALLFMVQPMAARMVLPRLGGSPAVWNTCMVFFQAVLLLGYGYAHLLTRWKNTTGQVILHAAVLVAGLIALPIAVPAGWAAPSESQSAPLWLIGLLALTVGAPFFVLSTTGPLLQRWFAGTDHPHARDPYFLYSASNIGSLASLLAYPVLLEPWLPLTTPAARLLPPHLTPWSQSTMWTLGYALFAALAVACGFVALKRAAPMSAALSAQEAGTAAGPQVSPAVPAPRPTRWTDRLWWVALAFVPSSLMLGVTQYLSTDIASMPLLWIVPLTIYLLTFIVAFSRIGPVVAQNAGFATAVLVVMIALSFSAQIKPALAPMLALHTLTLLAAGLACHGRLAASRPPARELTGFYFWIALGGVLGGAFNALAAPALFTRILEYPIALVAACILCIAPVRRLASGGPARRDNLTWALVAAITIFGLWAGLPKLLGVANKSPVMLLAAGAIGLALIGDRFVDGPARRRLPAALAAVLALIAIFVMSPTFLKAPYEGSTLYASRTFFGVYRVKQVEPSLMSVGDATSKYDVTVPAHHLFMHGTTNHGTQFTDPAMASVATSYYHRSGPIGQVFQTFEGTPKLSRVAVIGLGAGSLATYAGPGQETVFFEIDPEVIRIANDPALFSLIRDARQHRGATVRCVAGDGRLQIAKEPDGAFGLIVLDAFSSDAIPAHLLTKEAVEIYLRKLAPGGIIVVHISNHYLDLRPVLEAIAQNLGLAGLICDETQVGSAQQVIEDKRISTVVVLARTPADLGPLVGGGSWSNLIAHDRDELAPFLWTDDFSNILRILRIH